MQRHGDDAMYRSIELRKACCALRKLEPLARLLAGRSAWVTGLRREQSARAAPCRSAKLDEHGRIKFNPLADWTLGRRLALHRHRTTCRTTRCTTSSSRASAARPAPAPSRVGEDFRAGRWWWEDEDAKECGLHVQPPSATHGHRVANEPQRLRMNAPVQRRAAAARSSTNSHLDALEEEAIFILREVAATFERPALLFSGGKDSCVVLRLAEKAFKRSQATVGSPARCRSRCCTSTPATTSPR